MITGGSFRNEKFVLSAETEADASMIKSGLCGKMEAMALAPFGNKVSVQLQANNILFKKQSGLPLTYEEAHTLIKKIFLFDKLSEKVVSLLQKEARVQLNAPLTLFYPDPSHPKVQIAFSYNWVSFEAEHPQFAFALPKVHDAIKMAKSPSIIKTFSNDTNTISIHNYDMGGLYIPRGALEAIAQALVECALIAPQDTPKFVLKIAAFGANSVIFMDARQLCQNVDETFDITDDTSYNPLIGQQSFITPIMASFQTLVKETSFSALSKDQLNVLRGIILQPDSLKNYKLSESIAQCISCFAREFQAEIGEAYKQAK